jgi:serine/threonine protein kinase/Flp pilus assembly protein TadD
MIHSQGQREPVERLAEEFLQRHRRGEQPSVTEYADRYPDLAEEIRDVFPTLLVLEEVAPRNLDPALPRCLPGAEDQPLQQLGDYRILREVGRGGMGIVYEAEHQTLRRHVALKVLPAGSARDALCLERFEREARAAARLHHTNIVPVFDVGTWDGIHYYAMQFIDGQGLDEVLRSLRQSGAGATPASDSGLSASSGPPYYRSVARIGLQVAEALAYAHTQNILHRDIKPANLLLDLQGTVWVTDFGLAKQEGDDLTKTGDVLGTLRYMAPERFSGTADQRSDLYSLGLTLYELLCLRAAFEETDRGHLVKQITETDPPRPTSVDPRLPRDLETIVLKSMAKEPGRRYQSARELADDLQRFLADRPIRARRSGVWEHAWRWCRRNRLVASLAGLLVVVLVAVGVGGVLSAYQFRSLALQADEAKHQAEENARQIQESMERQNRAYQLLERGQVHLGIGRLDRALADFTEAATLRPDLAGIWTARGGSYQALRLYELAAQDLAKAFELHRSPEADIWWLHAALRLYVRDFPGYAQTCSEMVKHFGTQADPRSSWWLAETFTLGAPSGVDPELTVELAKRALVHEPKSTAYARTFAAAQYRAERPAAALQSLQELSQAGTTPAHVEAQPLLALVHARLGNRKDARFWMEKCSQTFDQHLRAMKHHPLDWYYEYLGHYDLLRITLLYREARELIPDAPPTEEVLCDILEARSRAYLGQLDFAERCFTKAIERQPTNAQLWLMRGLFWAHQGQWARALADFDQAHTVRPLDDLHDLGYRAVLQLSQRAFDGHAESCREMVGRFGDTNDVDDASLITCICASAPQGIPDPTARVLAAERSLSRNPERSWSRLALGAALYRAGRYQDSVPHLRQALNSRPPNEVAPDARAFGQLFLSMALERLGESSEAAQLLRSARDAIDRVLNAPGSTNLGDAWHPWAECQALREEAESLLSRQAKPPPK